MYCLELTAQDTKKENFDLINSLVDKNGKFAVQSQQINPFQVPQVLH